MHCQSFCFRHQESRLAETVARAHHLGRESDSNARVGLDGVGGTHARARVYVPNATRRMRHRPIGIAVTRAYEANIASSQLLNSS
jgi:hypothetical protein